MIRAQLAEFGITVRKGVHHALKVVDRLLAGEAVQVPALALTPLMTLAELVRSIQQQIVGLEGQLMVWFRGSERARRLATIPGIGYLTATALAATVTEPQQFSSGRQFAAWLGLTPRQNSSGGKEQLGRISKMGDRYLTLC